MHSLELSGAETADHLLKRLVWVRALARLTINHRRKFRELVERHRALAAEGQHPDPAHVSEHVAALEEKDLQLKFDEISVGLFLHPLCKALDTKAPQAAILDALCVGQADRLTDNFSRYGNKTLQVITVLDLENSATKADGIEFKPLKWCHTMAFMNAIQTSEKLDRTIHEGANAFFGGAFGQYRERPLTERLAGRAM